ncbi:hypothetical protein CLF_106567 [Clonorchis sinensis]|uniref:Uncharacterized protein n=1 Tax=Clonorchis sinensis TaxID=79923 RepID=G7YFC7_CLOSI|nr:hypothetical protein CLF_106567 [Clonorchis sinensis]
MAGLRSGKKYGLVECLNMKRCEGMAKTPKGFPKKKREDGLRSALGAKCCSGQLAKCLLNLFVHNSKWVSTLKLQSYCYKGKPTVTVDTTDEASYRHQSTTTVGKVNLVHHYKAYKGLDNTSSRNQ